MRVPANQIPCNLHMLSTRNVVCFPGYQKSENCKCFFSLPLLFWSRQRYFVYVVYVPSVYELKFSKEVDLECTGSVFLITIQMQISTYKPSNFKTFKQDFVESTFKVFLAKLCKVRKISLNFNVFEFYFYIHIQTAVLNYLQPQFQFQFSN